MMMMMMMMIMMMMMMMIIIITTIRITTMIKVKPVCETDYRNHYSGLCVLRTLYLIILRLKGML